MIPHLPKGMTSPEVAAVLFAAFLLLGTVYLGAVAYKARADRAQCILNIRNAQTAGRSWQGMYSKCNAAPFHPSDVIGPGKFLDSEPLCPAFRTRYNWVSAVPPLGSVYMTCPLAAGARHHPTDTTGW